jgi:hypothetical protein
MNGARHHLAFGYLVQLSSFRMRTPLTNQRQLRCHLGFYLTPVFCGGCTITSAEFPRTVFDYGIFQCRLRTERGRGVEGRFRLLNNAGKLTSGTRRRKV